MLSALFQIHLVLAQLLSHIGSTLLRQDVLEFNVELFFLLDEHVLFGDFFSLGNQALLQTLDLLDQLIGLDIGRLQLSPSVDVEGLLELVGKELGLLLLLKQLLLKEVDLTLEIGDTLGFFLGVDQLSLAVLDDATQVPDVLHLLLVVNLSFLQG